ncbi:DUF2550 family protein [Arsenicicoccus piscis]|uniref:DUF2550 family protein n=1 Tax=Arsenicicoccus piscis TaxID=673954 RepID=UPI0024E177DE|nr:DUF2550 family protein [Arsenicicoccus piscis]
MRDPSHGGRHHARTPVAGDMPALVDDPIVLRSQLGAEVVEIALPRPAYTSMRSWFEAAPPGIGHSA